MLRLKWILCILHYCQHNVSSFTLTSVESSITNCAIGRGSMAYVLFKCFPDKHGKVLALGLSGFVFTTAATAGDFAKAKVLSE
jgi:hypothetical protein